MASKVLHVISIPLNQRFFKNIIPEQTLLFLSLLAVQAVRAYFVFFFAQKSTFLII